MMRQARIVPELLLLRDQIAGDNGKTLWVLMAAIGVVLLIARANVANLLLVRAAGIALALRGGGRAATASRERHLARNTLTLFQVALALILLIGPGLMIHTCHAMRRFQPDFTSPGTLATLHVTVSREAARNNAELRRFHQRVAERVFSLTGVQSLDPIWASGHTYGQGQIPPLRRFLHAAPCALPAPETANWRINEENPVTFFARSERAGSESRAPELR